MFRGNKEKEKEIFFPEQRGLRQEWETRVTQQHLQSFHSLPPALPTLLQSCSGLFLQCTDYPQRYKISPVSLESSAVPKCTPGAVRYLCVGPALCRLPQKSLRLHQPQEPTSSLLEPLNQVRRFSGITDEICQLPETSAQL